MFLIYISSVCRKYKLVLLVDIDNVFFSSVEGDNFLFDNKSTIFIKFAVRYLFKKEANLEPWIYMEKEKTSCFYPLCLVIHTNIVISRVKVNIKRGKRRI